MKQAHTTEWEREGRGCHARRRGFTLIELLTVISIIALVAGLVIGLGPGASRNMKMKRVQSDLQMLMTAIENYKSKYGSYPPDNQRSVAGRRLSFPNQLFYELTGCVYSNNTFTSLYDNGAFVTGLGGTPGRLTTAQATTVFGADGIQNAHEDAAQARNFVKDLKPALVGAYTNANNQLQYALVSPVKGPRGTQFYWNYISKNPTNNPQTFDLWVEVVIGRQTNVVGNWKE